MGTETAEMKFTYDPAPHGGYYVRASKGGTVLGIAERNRITGRWKAYRTAGAVVAQDMDTRDGAARKLIGV